MRKSIRTHWQKAASSARFVRVVALNVAVFAGTHILCAQEDVLIDSDSVSVGLYFHKSDSRLDPAYRDNGVSIRRLYEAVASHDNSSVKAVEILSASSPEGNLAYNSRLSDSRAQAVINAISGLPGFCADNVDVVSAGEDWKGLESLLSPENHLVPPPPPCGRIMLKMKN